MAKTQSGTGGGSPSRRKKTIWIVGADDYNLALIRRLPDAESWDVRPVLHFDDVQPPTGRIDFEDLYRSAHDTIAGHDAKPDAIIGYLDFPVTSLVSLLQRDFKLRGASPEAVARCEHKYWMRLCQRKVMPEDTPEFAAVNPFNTQAARAEIPVWPCWLKPVKAHSSVLGFHLRDKADLDKALHPLRQKIHLFGDPFNHFLAEVDTEELDGIDGNFAVAEAIISAPSQFTLEGFVHRGETVVYGAVDSLRTGQHGSSLTCYRYPGELPEEVVERAREITAKVLSGIGFDDAPFNVEFFWDEESGALNLLEINPRISKSHSPLFEMVDGASHHKIAIDLALGRKPKLPHRKGKDSVAGKFMLRSYEADGIVQRVPKEQEIAELERILPDIDVHVLVKEGQKLSDLFYQESYSYELAEVFLGGENEEMLEDAYRRTLDSLPIHLQPMPILT